jgi:hypothetical protein
MWFRTVLLFVVSALVLHVPAKAQLQDSDIKKGKVYVSGENPGISLLPSEDGEAHTSVSFWRIIYSPVGMGHILFIDSDPTGDGPSSDDLRAAFTDNNRLTDYLIQEVLGTFNKSYIDNPYPKRAARFEKAGDTLTEWKEIAKADGYTIELVWRDFYPSFQLDTPLGGEALGSFGVTSFFIPAKSADVIINGKKAVGRTFPRMLGSMQSSTAVLAFSETWVK